MKGLKKVTAAVLLATIMSMGANEAWAGVVETPGHTVIVGGDNSGGGTDGTAESPGLTLYGVAESPGFFEAAIIFTATLIM